MKYFLLTLLFLIMWIGCRPVMYGQLPNITSSHWGFIPNQRQITDQYGRTNTAVLYLLPTGRGLNVQLRAQGFSYDTYQIDTDGVRHFHRIDATFVNANPHPIITAEAPAGEVLYFSVMNLEGVRHYQKITYRDIYPNIDVEFIASPNAEKLVEYNFILRPGARPDDIRLRYSGAAAVIEAGNLCFETAHGALREHIPVSYRLQDQTPVAVHYRRIAGDNTGITVGFAAPEEVVAATLVVDPVPTLSWGTYLGGTGDDNARALTLDAVGNIYITGTTGSLSAIATAGAHQATISGNTDAFVAKFNRDGARQWSTYFGGSEGEAGQDIALDNQGNIYVVGLSNSINGISTPGVGQSTNSGGGDAFLVKFNNNGIRQWGTYLGGSAFDFANAVVIDNAGNAYVGGWTRSANAPATPGVHQTAWRGEDDAFLAKIDPNGQRLWWTFFGDIGFELGLQLAMTPAGNVLLSGWTSSTANIATPGTHQPVYGGGRADAFLAQFNPNGQLNWATYYGGSDEEYGDALAVDVQGNIYMAGPGNSTNGLATPGSHQPAPGGGGEAFLVKFNSAGARQWGTYYGGSNEETAYGVALDNDGAVYLTGFTRSNNNIATPNAHQTTFGGNEWDAFLAKFNANGVRQWGSYYGGANSDQSYAIAVDNQQQIVIAGVTGSTGSIATPNAHQTTFGGGASDAFVARFAPCEEPTLNVPNGGYLCRNQPFVLELRFRGSAPFTFTYTLDGVAQPPITVSDTMFILSIASAQYRDSVVITSVRSGQCEGIITGRPFVRVLSRLSNTMPTANCDAASRTYTVSFQIFGSEPLNNYIPSVGFVNGNVYTSPPIPFGQDYDIRITTTQGCDTLRVRGSSGCAAPCTSFPIEISSNAPICERNMLSLRASGGVSYRWTGPANFISNEQNPTIPNATVANVGMYRVVVTNANGCQDSARINVDINTAPVFNFNRDRFCSNEDISLMTVGGVSPLQYSVGAISQGSNTFRGLAPGNYNPVVRDANGCADTTAITVISAPVITNTTVTPITCSNPRGALSVSATGTGAVEYSINGTDFAPASVFLNLNAGDYMVFIRDASGCVARSNATIRAENTPVISAVEVQPTTCGERNGSITISASGGAGPLGYSVNRGMTYQTSNRFTNLAGGNYTIAVRDQNNCEITAIASVATSFPPPVITAVNVEQSSCEADRNAITIVASGGNGKSQFSINSTTFQESNRFVGLRPGGYTVTVRDETGCTATSTANILPVNAPRIRQVSVQPATCQANNGRVAVTVSGGTGILRFALNDTLTQENSLFENIAAGAYLLAVTDEAGCRATQQVSVRREECPVFIPNAFSPNDDGANDELAVFAPGNISGTVRVYQIFDRWGNLLYEATDFPLGADDRWWKGRVGSTVAPVGVYVYYVAIELDSGEKISKKGSVQLIR